MEGAGKRDFLEHFSSQFDLRAHQETHGGDQANLAVGVAMRVAMLQIDYADQAAAAAQGNGKKGLLGGAPNWRAKRKAKGRDSARGVRSRRLVRRAALPGMKKNRT
jgi:hypothetical protein